MKLKIELTDQQADQIVIKSLKDTMENVMVVRRHHAKSGYSVKEDEDNYYALEKVLKFYGG